MQKVEALRFRGLYNHELAREAFKEAKDIIWQLEKEKTDAHTMTFSVISAYGLKISNA
jgi:hypothetical protein